MFAAIARKIFGSANDRLLRPLYRQLEAINALEPGLAALDETGLRAQTAALRARLAGGEELETLLPEAFATVREAARRVLGQRHFDVQLLGGMVLHAGRIAEMKTGEGKTLVATLPVYLNALTGKGVHVVTVNDYLARRDSAWMGRIYEYLGLRVGCIVHGLSDAERRAAYAADITYGTNNEFGFDYLRDNMKFTAADLVQRPFHFAIVDEVDSILIDEARTPLIISGPAEDSSLLYQAVNQLIPQLADGDFEKDEKQRTVAFTEEGVEKIEELLAAAGLLQEGGLWDVANLQVVHHATQALRAHKLFTRDVDYIVRGGKVMIIDEFTGRMMEGRRYADGLHQALEAKEGVAIQRENQTLASITFQNYFRLYPRLAGMTGTALTEAAEFAEIYKLEVVEIPTNLPVAREDMEDEVYRTAAEKYEAIIKQIAECRARQQPVLVGTVSIEKSELLADLLQRRQIPHQVLNARYHEQEAFIIAQAGMPGAVTIATNMAGRGTDIQLGGNVDMRLQQELADIADPNLLAERAAAIRAEVAAARDVVRVAGGLFVIGTERHESRRIDNQLRGRSGRQGDPGASRFYLSLDDDLMRIFGSERIQNLLPKLGLLEGEAIIHPWISTALRKAQEKVEARNFDIRKNLLKFDNVINDQRKVIYEQRREIMAAADLAEMVRDIRTTVLEAEIARAIPPNSYREQWGLAALEERLRDQYGLPLPIGQWAAAAEITEEMVRTRILTAADEQMAAKETALGNARMRDVEKTVLLSVLDQVWKDHLLGLDQLRQGIHLRAHAQRDPFNEYGREGFALFDAMLTQLRQQVTGVLLRAEVRVPSLEELAAARAREQFHAEHAPAPDALGAAPPPAAALPTGMVRRADAPVGLPLTRGPLDPQNPASWTQTPRNAPCPCGSGKKYKHCHGAL